MANQDIPSTPEGSPVALIVNVVAEQWKSGLCSAIPEPPPVIQSFNDNFADEFQ